MGSNVRLADIFTLFVIVLTIVCILVDRKARIKRSEERQWVRITSTGQEGVVIGEVRSSGLVKWYNVSLQGSSRRRRRNITVPADDIQFFDGGPGAA